MAKIKSYDTSHGSPFDRGSADSYYGRRENPHYWPSGSYVGERVDEAKMTENQIEAYYAGYDWNERFGGKKEW